MMKKPTPDTSGIHVWLVLWKAYRSLWRHAVRSINPRLMKHNEFTVLEALLHKGPQLVSELGRRAELTSGSITSAVDRLEKQGLVRRVSDVEDRRARMIHLTPKGKARVTKAFGSHAAAMERAAAGLTRAERATLIKLLKKLGLAASSQLTDKSRP
jgi:MarR family 2-MHQ and catechol resistance regulon transcriptional repressor